MARTSKPGARNLAPVSESAADTRSAERAGSAPAPRRRRGSTSAVRPLDIRENALVVGAQLFGSKGYAATSTRELTSALGTTNGNFYHHFATKEELLFEICQEALTRITDAVTAAIADVTDPLERLETLIRTHIQSLLADQSLQATTLLELRSLSGTNQDIVRARRDEYNGIMRGLIIDAQEAGKLRTDIDAATMTLVLRNMLNWTIFWYREGGRMNPNQLADVMVKMFVDAARYRPISAHT
jgi:AcrR family transcriptional regulator